MKFIQKSIVTVLAVGMLGMGVSQEVHACSKTANCYASAEESICGYVQGHLGGVHVVTEPNGYIDHCSVTVVSGEHTIKCGGCHVTLRTENRTCSEQHSNVHCFSRFNLCNY